MLYSTQDKLMIVGGSDFSEELFYDVYDKESPIIAADGGANFLADQSISPDLIIGDLDSVSEKMSNLSAENSETQPKE